MCLLGKQLKWKSFSWKYKIKRAAQNLFFSVWLQATCLAVWAWMLSSNCFQAWKSFFPSILPKSVYLSLKYQAHTEAQTHLELCEFQAPQDGVMRETGGEGRGCVTVTTLRSWHLILMRIHPSGRYPTCPSSSGARSMTQRLLQHLLLIISGIIRLWDGRDPTFPGSSCAFALEQGTYFPGVTETWDGCSCCFWIHLKKMDE